MSKMIPIECEGQFFYVENRNKNFMQYKVEVQLPEEEVDRALWYVKKYLIDEAIQGSYPEKGYAGVRTCHILTHLPDRAVKTSGGDVVEDMDDVQEDMFEAGHVDASDEFSDVGEVVGNG